MEPVPESVNDMAGVDSRFTVASAVILYAGPAVSIFLGSPLLTESMLQLLVFGGALFGLFSLLIPGLIALGLADGSSEVTSSHMQTLFENRALLVVFDCIFHDLMRLCLVYFIVRGERFFRRNGQVMYHSNIRLLPLGAAAGFGFGFLRGMCVVASSASVTMNVETTTSNAGFVRNSPSSLGVYVNLDSCSAMPLLVQQSASHLFGFWGDLLWTMMFVPFVAGIVLKEDNTSMVATTTPSAAAAATASSTNNNNKENENNNNSKRKEKENDPRWYEPTTTTTLQQLLFFFIALVTHWIFGLISLVNTEAIDFTSSLVNKERGCTVALSVQAVMIVIAGIAAAYLTIKIEKFPSHLMKWIKESSSQNTPNHNASTNNQNQNQNQPSSAQQIVVQSRPSTTSSTTQQQQTPPPLPMNSNDL